VRIRKLIHRAILIASVILIPMVVGVWIYSYESGCIIAWRKYGLIVSNGDFSAAWSDLDDEDDESASRMTFEWLPPTSMRSVPPQWRLGTVWFVRIDYRPWRNYWLTAPAWLVTAALALIPTFVGARLVFRRPVSGGCASCGYDLRATPDRCPECGTVPDRSAKEHSCPKISND